MIVKVAANEAAVVERLGRIHAVLSAPGMQFIAPVIDRVARRYSLEPQTVDVEANVIAYDNSVLRLTATATYKIADVRKVHESVADVASAVRQLITTALIDEAGKRTPDQMREESRAFRADVVRAANAGAETMGLKITDVEIAR